MHTSGTAALPKISQQAKVGKCKEEMPAMEDPRRRMRLNKGLQKMEGAWILLLLLRLQPYESSAPDGMVIVGILEQAIDRQAFKRHQNDDVLMENSSAQGNHRRRRQDSVRSRPAVRLHEQ